MQIARPVLLGIFYFLSYLFFAVSAEAKRASGESQVLTVSVYNEAEWKEWSSTGRTPLERRVLRFTGSR
jgi:hypothetical protein